MPDLGKYTDVVLSAYGASVVLLTMIVVVSVLRGRKIRADMHRMESKRNDET
ncbi:MAG: heme exporter protein CcmD [Aestuariivita sp.]|nr:heme exporter protein CcmD [Aestuariivita sp.]